MYFWSQFFLSFLFIGIVSKFTFQIVGDRACTFYFLLGFFSLYPTLAFILDMFAYGDALAFLFLFSAIYLRQPVLIFLALQCSFWVDERALLNSGFVLLWYILIPQPMKKQLGILATILNSGFIYLILRYIISQSFKIEAINKLYFDEFLTIYWENLKIVGFRIWCGFESYWILIILSIALLLYKQRYMFALLLTSMITLSVNLSFIVFDTNRAISYGFLSLFIALHILRQYMTTRELRLLLLFIFLASSIFPLANHLRLSGGYTLI